MDKKMLFLLILLSLFFACDINNYEPPMVIDAPDVNISVKGGISHFDATIPAEIKTRFIKTTCNGMVLKRSWKKNIILGFDFGGWGHDKVSIEYTLEESFVDKEVLGYKIIMSQTGNCVNYYLVYYKSKL